jgi:hypothetical protein
MRSVTRDMIRMGVERALIKSDVTWFGYRELRSITSHVYDLATAKKVLGSLGRILRDAKELQRRLDKAAK